MIEITLDALRDYEARGLVHASRHPTLPLTVFCYTRTVQFERCWDNITRNARGLVLDDDGVIVGRGLPKFFAVGDPLCEVPSGNHGTFDKADGTLIHVAKYDGQLVTWTKASFNTEHSAEAHKYLEGWEPNDSTTALFEGIFGFNRVVINYGTFRGLILLGEVENRSGKDWKHPEEVAEETGWPGEIVQEQNMLRTDLETLCADPEAGSNREGFVLVWPREGAPSHRVKIKFAQYLILHRTMTNLTHRRVHEMFLARMTEPNGVQLWDEFLDLIPDEMDTAVQAVVNDIVAQAELIYQLAVTHVSGLKGIRREVAALIGNNPDRKYIWLAFDHKWEALAVQALRAVEVPVEPLLVIEDDDA